MNTVALGEVAVIERESISSANIADGETYVGLEHIASNGEFVGVGPVAAGDLQSAKFRFDDRHVLYGKLRPNLCKIARPSFSGVCSTDILPVRPRAGLDRGYLFHFLRTPAVVRHATKLATGANLPRLSPKALTAFEIPLPPIDEQRRVASVLDAADALRAKRRQALAKLDYLTQAVFIDMFGDPVTGSRRPRMPIGSLAKVVTGNTPSRSDPANYGAGIEWVKSDNITESGLIERAAETLSALGRARSREAHAGASLVVCIAGSPRSIGRVGLLDRPVAFNQQINAVVPGDQLLPEFLFYQLVVGKRLIQRASTDSMKGLVSKSALSAVEILAPTLDAQAQFVTAARAISPLRAAARISLGTIDTLIASLQQRAFRGDL